ncbi:MAG: hypothetical protein ACRDHP_14585 [Ktedonobacterales bacterium]
MIERLQRALEHVEELPATVQEEVAELLEQFTEPYDIPTNSLAGSMPDLPDDAEEILLRWRHESPPSPPMDEQLGRLEEE